MMSEYQFNCWRFSDLSGADNLLHREDDDVSHLEPTATISLADAAISFLIDTDDDHTSNSPDGALFLSAELMIGDTVFPAGSPIIPEAVLRTSGTADVRFIIARVVVQTSAAPHDDRIVIASTQITPGMTFDISDIRFSADAGPGQNCFSRGTLIETPHGALPIEQLEDGDEVLTPDGSVQLISWIGYRRLSGLELVFNPELRPVRIMAGALTGGRPGQDLLVSQNHRLLVDDWRAPYLFGEEEILVPAKSLLNDTNVVTESPMGGVDYFHLLVNGHDLVCANGLWAETMLPDDATLTMLDPQQQREVAARLRDNTGEFGAACKTVLPALSHHAADSIAA